jgi:predicted phage terminase large subunit-like protein
VCITAHVRRRTVYLLDVYRDRLGAPQLNAKVRELARHHRADALLVEDTAGGTQLLQWLLHDQPDGVPLPIACQPEGAKEMRLYGACPHIEAGGLILPAEAPWLADFERELLGFPNARYDDQVDALTQLLSWAIAEDDYYDLSNIVIPRLLRPNPWRIGDGD